MRAASGSRGLQAASIHHPHGRDKVSNAWDSCSCCLESAAHSSCLPYPKHLPDLMPLDFGFWPSVNKRLRKQEAAFDDDYMETRRRLVARLRRTILRTPRAVLMQLIEHMPVLCKRLKKAQGWHFEEGKSRG